MTVSFLVYFIIGHFNLLIEAWIFNVTDRPETNQLIVYDDEESVKLKCEYVIDNNMGGMMFWQYASDTSEYLLDAINENLYL